MCGGFALFGGFIIVVMITMSMVMIMTMIFIILSIVRKNDDDNYWNVFQICALFARVFWQRRGVEATEPLQADRPCRPFLEGKQRLRGDLQQGTMNLWYDVGWIWGLKILDWFCFYAV